MTDRAWDTVQLTIGVVAAVTVIALGLPTAVTFGAGVIGGIVFVTLTGKP